jgi:hypothetical protein
VCGFAGILAARSSAARDSRMTSRDDSTAHASRAGR